MIEGEETVRPLARRRAMAIVAGPPLPPDEPRVVTDRALWVLWRSGRTVLAVRDAERAMEAVAVERDAADRAIRRLALVLVGTVVVGLIGWVGLLFPL